MTRPFAQVTPAQPQQSPVGHPPDSDQSGPFVSSYKSTRISHWLLVGAGVGLAVVGLAVGLAVVGLAVVGLSVGLAVTGAVGATVGGELG